MHSWYLHCVGEHASKSERYLLGKLLSSHGHLEAVSKVNVQYTPGQTIQHQVRQVPVGESVGGGVVCVCMSNNYTCISCMYMYNLCTYASTLKLIGILQLAVH